MSLSESREHIAFKKIAIDILKEKGFDYKEIKEEYPVECSVDGKVKYRVDIAGVKDNYKVAIECGKVDPLKLINLRKVFDEVLVVDVEKIVEMYEYWKTRYFTETRALREELKSMEEHMRWMSKNTNKRSEEMREEAERLREKIRSLERKLNKYRRVMAEAWMMLKEEGQS